MNKANCIKALCKAAFMIIYALMFTGCLDPFHEMVDEANNEYNAKNYTEAEQKYNEAMEETTDDEAKKRLAYNNGTAQYMAENYEGAIEHFKDAITADDNEVQKKSFFNMGNAYLKMDKKREAFEAYSNALKVDPEYEAAKKNIEYLLKEDDSNNQNNQQNNDQNQNNQNNQNQNNQQNNNENQNNQQQQQNQQQRQMSADQVKNLLDSMKNKPVERSKGKGGQQNNDKNW